MMAASVRDVGADHPSRPVVVVVIVLAVAVVVGFSVVWVRSSVPEIEVDPVAVEPNPVADGACDHPCSYSFNLPGEVGGAWILSLSADGQQGLWTGERGVDALSTRDGVLGVAGHVGGISSATIAPDGSSALAYGDPWSGWGEMHREGQTWQKGETIADSSVAGIFFSGDGKTAFFKIPESQVLVYGQVNGSWVKKGAIIGSSGISASNFDGTAVAQIDFSQKVILLFAEDSAGWQKTQRISLSSGFGKSKQSTPDQVLMSGDGLRILVSHEERYATLPRSVAIFDRSGNLFRQTAKLNLNEGVRAINFSGDGQTAIIATDDKVTQVVYRAGVWRVGEAVHIPRIDAISTTVDGSETVVSKMDMTASVIRW